MTRHGMLNGNSFYKQLNLLQPNPNFEIPSRAEDDVWRTFRHHKASPSAVDVDSYTQPFLSFISQESTVFHAVSFFANRLQNEGFIKLSERQSWIGKLTNGGKYFFERNGSSLVAFVVGGNYEPGNGAAVIASHVDVITTRLKPISTLPAKAGVVQLGVAPYAGGLNDTWWDRDLGVGGRVLVKNSKTGKVETRLVKLGWPIARIPTLAPHFGAASRIADANKETRLVPIIGLEGPDDKRTETHADWEPSLLGGAGTFMSTQPPRLVKAIARALGIEDYASIVNWELELFDTQPAQLGGLDREFIFAGRIDDRLCAFSAIEALVASAQTSQVNGDDSNAPRDPSGIIKIVGLFDDEEIGSLLRQGARSNLLPSTIERIIESLSSSSDEKPHGANVLAQTYANSFLISADVTHAANPNYLDQYLANHAPHLNVGVAIQADPNGHTTTDSVSTALLQAVADRCGATLQVFQIRNDSRSGGTVGPSLSSSTGMRAVDAGLAQLSMHSIRATTGSREPGLGVQLFKGFFDHFEEVDAEFE